MMHVKSRNAGVRFGGPAFRLSVQKTSTFRVDRIEFMPDQRDRLPTKEAQRPSPRHGTNMLSRPQYMQYAVQRLVYLAGNHSGRD